VTVCRLHHTLIHEGFIRLHVDEEGKVRARNTEGRFVGREIPATEVLAGAPEELSFIGSRSWRVPRGTIRSRKSFRRLAPRWKKRRPRNSRPVRTTPSRRTTAASTPDGLRRG
jgi:hypothetical protein